MVYLLKKNFFKFVYSWLFYSSWSRNLFCLNGIRSFTYVTKDLFLTLAKWKESKLLSFIIFILGFEVKIIFWVFNFWIPNLIKFESKIAWPIWAHFKFPYDKSFKIMFKNFCHGGFSKFSKLEELIKKFRLL